MNKLFRVFSLFLVVSLLMTSLPVNALATDVETVPAAEDVFESEAILSDELIPVGLPEEEVFAAPIQEAIIEEEPEMDLMQAMGLTAEGEPTPEPENTEEPGITPEPEETDEPDGEEMPETGIEPETSEEPGAKLLPGADLLQGADLLPEITGEPELFPEGEVEEVPVEPEMSVLPGVVYTIGGAGEIAVELPETAMPVAEVEGLVCDGDYYVNDTGIVLTTAWLDTLAPGEVLVCILGADGVLYVQPVVAVEMVINNTEVDYDIVNLRVNGEDLFAGSGTNWTYDAETGVLTLTGESAVSGSGVVQSVDVATDAAITLSSLELTVGNAAAFTCNTLENSAVNLVLTGENTVAAANLTSAELIVSGEGSLKCGVVSVNAFAVEGGVIQADSVAAAGDIVLNGGTLMVAGVIQGANLTVAEGAELQVEAEANAENYKAVMITGTLSNRGKVSVKVSGSAKYAYAVHSGRYTGENDQISIINECEANSFFGISAPNGLNSTGTISVRISAACSMVYSLNDVPGSGAVKVANYDLKVDDTCTVGTLYGIYSNGVVTVLEGGLIDLCMDNADSSVGLRAGGILTVDGNIRMIADQAASVTVIDSQKRLTVNGDIQARFTDCGSSAVLKGRADYGYNTDFNGNMDILVDGGDSAKLFSYNIYYGDTNVKGETRIEVRNVRNSVCVFDTLCALGSGPIRIYAYDNPCEAQAFGSTLKFNENSDVYVTAKKLGYDYKYANQAAKPLEGCVFTAKDGVYSMEYLYTFDVNGNTYEAYPNVCSASGEGWEYNAEDSVLVLDGFNGESIIGFERIDKLYVVLKGENSMEYFESDAEEVVFSGEGTLSMKAVAGDDFNGIYGKKITFEGGNYTIEGYEVAVWGEEIAVTGGSISIGKAGFGLRSDGDISVGNSARIEVDTGYRALLADGGIRIAGEPADLSAVSSILIENGAIISSDAVRSLSVADFTFHPDEIVEDQSGEGWKWDNDEKVLHLDEFLGVVSYNGDALKVSVDGAAYITGLYGENITVGGDSDTSVMLGSLKVAALTADGPTIVLDTLAPVNIDVLEIKSGILAGENLIGVKKLAVTGGQGAFDTIEAGNIEISGGMFATDGKIICENYTQTGGEAEIGLSACLVYGDMETLVEAGSVNVTGGLFRAANVTGGKVFKADCVSIGGTADAVVYARNQVADTTLLTIAGAEKQVQSLWAIELKSGEDMLATQPRNVRFSLNWGNNKSTGVSTFLSKHFDVYDKDWSWDCTNQRLMLNGFSGKEIKVYQGEVLNIYLVPGTVNSVSSRLMASDPVDITFSGSGAWTGDIEVADCDLTFNKVGLIQGFIISKKGDIKLTGTRMPMGDLYATGGSMSITDCDITCNEIYAKKNLTAKNSRLEGLGFLEDESGNNIFSRGKATFKSCILMYGKYAAYGGTSSDKYTAAFKWGKNGYTLQKSATLNRNWRLPDRPYYIPSNLSLKISSGKTLYYMGSIKNKSRISGKTKAMGVPQTLTLSGKSEMATGTSQKLKLTSNPASANKDVIWMTDYPGICVVDQKGNVTIASNPLLAGQKVTVVASSLISGDCYAAFEITITTGASEVEVYRNDQEVKEIELWLDPANKTAQLTHQVFPYDASQEVTWKSTKSKVASVSADGVVTAKAAGTAYIYAVANDGTGVESQRVKVTVKKAPTSVKFTSTSATLGYDAEQGVGSSKQLKVKLSSGSASTITYKSSNAEVVTVDENGVITAKKAGKATITATTYNKKKATCKVTVKGAPDSIEINKAEHVMGLGDEYTFTAKIPSGSYGNWTFSSSDAAKVSVDAQTGAAKAEALGEAVITATSFNGKTDSCKVTVVPAPDGIKAPENLTLGKGETRYLNAEPTLTGDQATATTFTYSTSNKKVVTVDANGKLRAMATGKAVITIMTHNEVTATCEVVVKKAPTSIKLSHKKGVLAHDEKLNLGTAYQLTAKLSSGSASEIKFTSSNTKVAKVDENGLITTVGVGTAKIKATTFNKKYATCTVTVMPAPENMIFGKDSYVVAVDDKITVEAEAEFGTYSPTVEYGSKDLFVAMVDKDTGLVTPTDIGTTTLTATGFNGAAGTAEIKVVNSPDTLTLNAYKGTLKVGKKFTIVPTVTRTDLKETAATYTFRSNRPSVCTVSASGKLVGRKKGTAVITVRTHNGLEATVRVTVK